MGSNEKKRKTNVKQIVYLVVFLLLAGAAWYAYPLWVKESSLIPVTFKNPDGQITEVLRLEVAADQNQRSKGLMYRKPGELAANRGMIFLFPNEEKRAFWMKNTYISLDMLFLDRNFKVVGILNDVPVLNQEKREVDARSQYVVELLAGSCKRMGIVEGSIAQVQGELPKAKP